MASEFEPSFWLQSTFHNSTVSSKSLSCRSNYKIIFSPKSFFVFTELHAENLKNEDDVDTGLLGMDFIVTWFDFDLTFVFPVHI